MPLTAHLLRVVGVCALVLAASVPARADDTIAKTACLAGTYDGGQMEIAAGLELGADGRFAYGLSYGALDEEAQGQWEADGASVLLTSDPVVEPKFTLVGEEPAAAGALTISLDLPPGISRQYFDVIVMLADGTAFQRQMAEDGLTIPLAGGARPVAMVIVFPVFSLRSERFALSGSPGNSVHVRFDPNDIGKVAFAHTPLTRENGDLLLERHERLLRFRPRDGGCRDAPKP